VEVVRYLDGHPEADTVEILGRWTGTAAHAVLVELLKSPVTLEDHALQGEFTDGVDKLLGALERNERRRLLAEVREAPTREKFREFWSLRQGGGPAAAGRIPLEGAAEPGSATPDAAAEGAE
jgi:hypothetical protein